MTEEVKHLHVPLPPQLYKKLRLLRDMLEAKNWVDFLEKLIQPYEEKLNLLILSKED